MAPMPHVQPVAAIQNPNICFRVDDLSQADVIENDFKAYSPSLCPSGMLPCVDL